MLGLAGVTGISGLMQRRLDAQRAELEGRGCASNRVIAFEDADFSASFRQQSAGCQSSESRTDHNGVKHATRDPEDEMSHYRGTPRRRIEAYQAHAGWCFANAFVKAEPIDDR